MIQRKKGKQLFIFRCLCHNKDMTDSKKILLIEDDVFILGLLSDKFRQNDFEVDIAKDGEKGIEFLKSHRPDAILLDILLPKINGFEVLRQIKSSPVLAGIPVIIISNLGQKEEIEKAKQLGADDYIIKANFTTNEIVQKLNKILK